MTSPTAEATLSPHARVHFLDNGLTVILREDHSAPVVSAQAWCRAGSIDEGRWLGAGLSHVLEHMLFKGTTTRGSGRIDQEVQEAGGYMNAYTSFDRTVYWINVPNTGGRVAIDILADIVQHATLPADELAREMDVIRREMDMGYDDPSRRSSRRLFETAYTRSPYRYTIIGYPDVFNRLTREDILAYYQEKYSPDNLVFVVVGDVDAAAVLAQIREAFAGAKSRPLPPVVLPEEPRQLASREVIEEAAVELVHLHYSWHIPDLRHPDVPVLDVLATLLGAGRSSRLFREVREKQGLVASVDAWTYNPGSSGLMGMSALLEAQHLPAARAAMLAEIERMRTVLVTGAELSKAVKQFVAATLGARKTMQGQAQDLGGSWIAASHLEFSERYLAAIKQVRPEDILRVAREYLTEENRTLYALVPAGAAVPAVASVAVTTDLPIRKDELPNGLRLLVKEDHRLPFVEFRLVALGGVLSEDEGNNGVTHLLARMLLQGTRTRTAEAIANEIESVGGNIETYNGNNSLGVTAEVLSGDFNVGLRLVSEVWQHPIFPADALDRERTLQLAALKSIKDHLLQCAFRSLRRTLFGRTGYGLDSLGTEESVLRLSGSDLSGQHRRLAVPDNTVLAIYGDVQAEAVRTAVAEAFEGWSRGLQAEAPRTVVPAREEARQRSDETREKKQAVLAVGFPGGTLRSPDRYALDLLQEACSDLGSRLFLRIREELGLAYYVGATNFVGLVPGYFAFYAGTAPEHAERVEQELLAEAISLANGGLTEDELRRAKAKVIGQKKIARQDLGGFALATALDELYGLGYANTDTEDARYEEVTLERVREVAGLYLRPERAAVAVIRGVAD